MMRRTTRTIEVFEQSNGKAAVRVEVEGETVSVQLADLTNPNNKLKAVFPKHVGFLFIQVLSSALAQEGGVVVENGLVHHVADSGDGLPLAD